MTLWRLWSAYSLICLSFAAWYLIGRFFGVVAPIYAPVSEDVGNVVGWLMGFPIGPWIVFLLLDNRR